MQAFDCISKVKTQKNRQGSKHEITHNAYENGLQTVKAKKAKKAPSLIWQFLDQKNMQQIQLKCLLQISFNHNSKNKQKQQARAQTCIIRAGRPKTNLVNVLANTFGKICNFVTVVNQIFAIF